MSDLRLRDAERRWRESGRLDDRVRWWSERVRAGEAPPSASALVAAVAGERLPADRVELAAYLGDEGAGPLAVEEVVERLAHAGQDAALRVALDEPGVGLEDVVAWLGAVRLWDRAALPRAAAAVTRHLAAALAGADLSPREDEDAWLHQEREWERESALRASEQALGAVEGLLAGQDRRDEVAAVVASGRRGFWTLAGPVFEAAVATARAALSADDEAVRALAAAVYGARPDPAALRAAVRDALVPWALGGG